MGMIATKNIHLPLVEIVPKIYLLNRGARLVEEWRGVKILTILFCKLHIVVTSNKFFILLVVIKLVIFLNRF